jgi:hypothetical protein
MIRLRGAFVIGLIVPSNAKVFGAGQGSGAVAASPFVHGQSCPTKYTRLFTHGFRYSRKYSSSAGLRQRRQCCVACLRCLSSKLGSIHRVANTVQLGSPWTCPKNLSQSHQEGRPYLGTTHELAIQHVGISERR